MVLIAHRGNLRGPNPEEENKPKYIERALNLGYNVEVDVWYDTEKMIWFLGHDKPQYEINHQFLGREELWVHCKNYEAFWMLNYLGGAINGTHVNYFYHTNEDYALTSRHYIWTYPGKPGGGYKSICVMPEWGNYSVQGFEGICTDYVEKYQDDFTHSFRS